MAGVFRFSNAVSDIRKFIDTYKVIYQKLKDTEDFTHDDATGALIENGLVSSSGAIGQEAVNRSRRVDRSRDPLYNQLKMYSEIYRMLGWYNPGSKRTNFVIPEYGEYIFDAQGALLRNHFELNVLHIVSPNPLVDIRSGNILRPFPLILKLLERLDGVLHRDEIILTVLACGNDRDENYIDEAEILIRSLRGNALKLEEAYEKLMKENGVNSKDVFRNYTRFILATLRWLDYAQPERRKGIYGSKSVNVYVQTELAKQKVKELEESIDIRFNDLEKYSEEENAAFAIFTLYHHLEQIGYDISDPDTQELISKVSEIVQPIFEQFGINDNSKILYFPYQETPLAILQLAKEYFSEDD
jgi:hypothetical protein